MKPKLKKLIKKLSLKQVLIVKDFINDNPKLTQKLSLELLQLNHNIKIGRQIF